MITSLSFACIAVRDLQQATDQYCQLFGLEVMQPPNDSTRFGFRNTFLGNGQHVLIELIEPLGPDSPIAKFLDTRGEGVYLI
ncbi:MAG: VOC family protein, partial [Chloroflexi bacterium]|nr:VOC family protein [Chloroflexota bacterium]